MPFKFSNDEYPDIYFIYRYCRYNSTDAAEGYELQSMAKSALNRHMWKTGEFPSTSTSDCPQN